MSSNNEWYYHSNQNKKSRRRRTLSLSNMGSEEHNSPEFTDDAETIRSTRAAESGEAIEAVHTALAAMPENFREILVLRELDGLSYEEISQVLEIKKGTVESRLFRARSMLRKVAERMHLENLL